MELSYDAFVRLLETFRAQDRDRPGADQRRAARVRHTAKVFVLPANGVGQPIPARLNDFSPRGVRILHNAPLEPGTSFVLQLTGGRSQTVSMLCVTVHCEPRSYGLFSIGAEFEGSAARPEPTAGDLERIRASVLD